MRMEGTAPADGGVGGGPYRGPLRLPDAAFAQTCRCMMQRPAPATPPAEHSSSPPNCIQMRNAPEHRQHRRSVSHALPAPRSTNHPPAPRPHTSRPRSPLVREGARAPRTGGDCDDLPTACLHPRDVSPVQRLPRYGRRRLSAKPGVPRPADGVLSAARPDNPAQPPEGLRPERFRAAIARPRRRRTARASHFTHSLASISGARQHLGNITAP